MDERDEDVQFAGDVMELALSEECRICQRTLGEHEDWMWCEVDEDESTNREESTEDQASEGDEEQWDDSEQEMEVDLDAIYALLEPLELPWHFFQEEVYCEGEMSDVEENSLSHD